MNKDTCGPAFPCVNHYGDKLTGMTLRDYFAAKAMQGLATDIDVGRSFESYGKWAYEMADAMLKAREQ